MNGTNCNENERGLLPYPVILAATKGDPDAMKIVMQHYQSYMLKQPNCPFVLYVGTRKLVKRREFEEYIRRELTI